MDGCKEEVLNLSRQPQHLEFVKNLKPHLAAMTRDRAG
jgi:hypothetical protein